MRFLAKLLVASFALAPQTPQTPPVFRAGVDLVTVDVAVVDRNGRPVTGLGPADFSVVAAKRPRRIVSAEYISATRRPVMTPAAGATRLPAPSTNTQLLTGRMFLFAIDVEEIARGTGQAAVKAIADYLDRLSPDDRVGLVSLPSGTPRVDPTTDRRLVRETLGKISGTSTRNQDDEMTVGEAAPIERRDEQALNDYLVRIRKPTPCLPIECVVYQGSAARIMDIERHHSHEVIDALRALAVALTPVPGPKALVLASQGLVADARMRDDVRRFADAAAAARVTLYGLNLEGSPADAGSGHALMGAHAKDHDVLLDGMATLAVAGRGDTFLVSGTPIAALERIDAEMAGYYLLAFERDPADRDGERNAIDVRVAAPDATVRWRKEFKPDTPPAATPRSVPADVKAAIGDMLRWPAQLGDISVAIDTYTLPSLPATANPHTIVVASFESGGQAIVAIGYAVTDGTGKAVVSDVVSGRVSTTPLRGDRRLYTATLAIRPGRYRVKLASIDASGRRGSVEHAFDVRIARAGGLQMGDIFIGELSDARFLPSPSLEPGAASLPIRVDLCGDTAADFGGAALTLELSRSGVAPFGTRTLSPEATKDPLRRMALATLAIGSLPPGEYVVTARLVKPGAEAIATSRAFTKR